MQSSMLVNSKQKSIIQSKGTLIWKSIKYNRYIYLFFLPAFMLYFVFSYIPMFGTQIAFKEFSFLHPFTGGDWVGLKNFQQIFNDSNFLKVMSNTLIISFGRIFFEFPLPIILALLLNEIIKTKARRFFQTVYTFPHFLSWVVVSGIFINILSDSGVVNQLLVSLGQDKIGFMTIPELFRGLIFSTDAWKETGWGTIIYLATIASINPELYEAAKVDGAKRFQMMRYITIPSIQSVIGIMLILSVGSIMNAGFDQVVNLYNPVVYDVADVIDTYVYRTTFLRGADYSYSTAIGLFKSLINCILLFSSNQAVKKMGNHGLF